MKDMTSKNWQRSGSSFIWSSTLLGPLVTGGDAIPLRVVLGWLKHGFPDSRPGNRQTVLVGGLQTVLETFLPAAPDDAFNWLRKYTKPLVRAFQSRWDRVGLVFAMDGPHNLFTFNEADELVYFGRSKERTAQVKLSLGIWNGAATGEGSFRLLVPETGELGGYYVNHVS